MAQHHPTPSDPLAKNEERMIRKDTLKAQPGADLSADTERARTISRKVLPPNRHREGGHLPKPILALQVIYPKAMRPIDQLPMTQALFNERFRLKTCVYALAQYPPVQI